MWLTIIEKCGDKISHKGILENISNQYKFVNQAISYHGRQFHFSTSGADKTRLVHNIR